MSGTVNPFAQFVTAAPPPAAPPAAPVANPFAQFVAPPAPVYPMAPVAPVAGQTDTYSNLPPQDVAPFQAGQAPSPGQGVAPPTVAPPQPAPPDQQGGPSITITPDQLPPGMVQASTGPQAPPPPSGGAPGAPPPAGPAPMPLPEDGVPLPAPPPPVVNPRTGEVSQPYQPYDHSPVQQLGDDALTLLQGATGYAPEIKSLITAAVPGLGASNAPSFLQRYSQNLAAARAAYAAIPAGVRTVGEIAGGVAPFVAGAGAVDAIPALNSLSRIAPSVLGKVGGGIVNVGLAGGTIGGIQGSGQAGPDDRVGGALRGEAFGALTGGVAPALGHVIGEGYQAAKNYLQPAFQRAERPIINKATGLPVFDTNPDGTPKVDADGNGVPLMASPSVQRIAGQRLARAQSAPNALSEAAATPEGVPGSQFTAGQSRGDKGLIKLESQLEKNPSTNPMFVERREAQAAANQAALHANAGGDVDHALHTFRAMRQAADETADQIRAPALAGNEQAARSVAEDGVSTEQHGTALRAPALAHDVEQKAVYGRMNAAVDPEGKLVIDARPLKAEIARMQADIPRLGGITAEESELFGRGAEIRKHETFKELSAYASDIAEKLRNDVNPGSQAEFRLRQLKTAVETAMDASVERRLAAEAAEVQAGTMAPEDTLASRIEGAADELQTATADNTSGANGGNSRVGAGSPRGQGATSELPRTGRGNTQGRASASGSGRIPSVVSASARSYPSLLSFLRRGGGVQDHGGELAAIFDNARSARGLVVRNGGHSLDYAREAAEERGYLRPGSDINDLLNAIAREHGGDKVFPEHIAAERELGAAQKASQSLYESHISGAREAVAMAAEDHSIHLTPDEHEQATDLVASGMHPDEAVQSVVTDTEAHEADLRAARAQQPGVPAAATQANAFPHPEEGLPLSSAADLQSSIVARRENNAFYAAHKRTQENPVGRAIFKRGIGGRAFATSDAALPSKVLTKGAQGLRNLQDYIAQGGSSQAAMEALAEQAQRAVVRNGVINPAALAKFRTDYAPILGHTEMLPLRGRLDNAEDAAQVFSEANAQAAEHLADFNRSAAARFLGAVGHEDAARVMMGLLRSTNSTAVLRQLRQQAGNNQAAIDGIKQILADGIAMASSSTRKEGTTMIAGMKPDAFKRIIRDRGDALSSFFSPNEMTNFQKLSDTLDMQARSGGLKNPTESATGHYSALMEDFKSKGAPVVALLKAIAGPAGLLYAGHALDHPLIGLTAAGLQGLLQAMHAAGMHGTDELVAYGLLHPGVGNILRANARPETVARLTRGLEVALSRSVQQHLQMDTRRQIGAEPQYGP